MEAGTGTSLASYIYVWLIPNAMYGKESVQTHANQFVCHSSLYMSQGIVVSVPSTSTFLSNQLKYTTGSLMKVSCSSLRRCFLTEGTLYLWARRAAAWDVRVSCQNHVVGRVLGLQACGYVETPFNIASAAVWYGDAMPTVLSALACC